MCCAGRQRRCAGSSTTDAPHEPNGTESSRVAPAGYARSVHLLAAGRNAEVYAYGEGRVLKLDRPDWNGLSDFENEMLELLAAAGLPVARPYGTVVIEGRHGVVLERIDGVPLSASLQAASGAEVDVMAQRFVDLQVLINTATVEGLPALLPRLRTELETTVTEDTQRAELLGQLETHHDETLGVVHYDLHPDNVLVTPEDHWVVIDWLTVAAGPATADLARTLVLRGRHSAEPMVRFLQTVRRAGTARRGIDDDTLDAWIRIVAAARLNEGFDGAEAAWLAEVASGARRLGV